jgi:D-amino-acid dehydrogenase
MKALVLGAGIAGITTAYHLNADGYDVTVIDREELPAAFTSYGNAGLFAPGHSYSWASPAAPGILMRSLWRDDQALRFRPSTDPAFWRWMWKFWRECNAERSALSTSRKANLCRYSLDVFRETVAATGVRYDGRDGGLLYLYRTPATFEAAGRKSQILIDNGIEVRKLDRDGIAEMDPALAPVTGELVGALYAPGDESGDCRMFARNMQPILEAKGVSFEFGTSIDRIETDGDRITGVITDQGKLTADVYILCLGVYSPHLARQLGVTLDIYPVKGYSVTVPTIGRNNVPTRGGVDEENLVAYCPLGDRMRITATAEFSGYSRDHSPADFRHMLKMAQNLFPEAADYTRLDYWAGLRPMTPSGTPLLGQARHTNLWYNTGLGHMGWTMSHATSRITADLIAGKKPAIDLAGMTVNR